MHQHQYNTSTIHHCRFQHHSASLPVDAVLAIVR
jgi:hypothetical protein